MSDFRFAHSYNGSAQPVQILAKRDINGDGAEDPVTVHYSINGGPPLDTPDRGVGRRLPLRQVRATSTTTSSRARSPVPSRATRCKVWFTGGGATSDSFTFDVVGSAPKDVLVVAAEDYSGHRPTSRPIRRPPAPHFLSLLHRGPNRERHLVRCLRHRRPGPHGARPSRRARPLRGRRVVHGQRLAHPRFPGNQAAPARRRSRTTRCSSCAPTSTRVVGLLYTGRNAGWQYANAFDYNPVSTPPFCDNVDQSVDDGCLLLSDDFLQYWLGAATASSRTAAPTRTGEPFPLAGNAGGPFAGLGVDAERRRQRRQPPSRSGRVARRSRS